MRKPTSSLRGHLPADAVAFAARKAIARFTQVEGVTDEEREVAWQRILAAARQYDVSVARTPPGRAPGSRRAKPAPERP